MVTIRTHQPLIHHYPGVSGVNGQHHGHTGTGAIRKHSGDMKIGSDSCYSRSDNSSTDSDGHLTLQQVARPPVRGDIRKDTLL